MLVAAAAHDAAVVAEPCIEHAVLMRRPFGYLPAFLHLPEMNGAVLAGGKQNLRVTPPTDRGDGGLMTGQGVEFLAAVGFPNHEAAVAVARCQQHAVGAVLNGSDPIGVLFEVMQQVAVARGEHFDVLARTAQGDLSLVRVEVRCQDGVILIADAETALT